MLKPPQITNTEFEILLSVQILTAQSEERLIRSASHSSNCYRFPLAKVEEKKNMARF